MKLGSRLLALMLALSCAGGATGAAEAAIVSKTYEFTAETEGPITLHQGRFSYQHDMELGSLTLTSITFSLLDVDFTLENTRIGRIGIDIMLGGLIDGQLSLTPSATTTYDFVLWFSDPERPNFVYTLPNAVEGLGEFWTATRVTLTEIPVSLDPAPQEVAEPGAFGLLAAGFAGLGLAAVRRRRFPA